MEPPPLASRRPRNPWVPLAMLGTVLLAIVVAAGTCVMLLVTRTNTDVLTLALDDVQPGGARLVPLTSFGADEEGRTHGLWVVRPDASNAFALLTVDAHSGCRVEWRADREYEGASPILRDPCAGSIYDAGGRRLFGPAPRDLDRFAAVVDADARTIEIAMDDRRLGACAPGMLGTADCGRAPSR